MAQPQKSIRSLIVDTGPLILNTISISTIVNSAERIYTTPAVIDEIRDEATRSRVETTLLPFLTLRSPMPASYEFVAAFSKKTGDFPVLSRQDFGILALAYEIDQEHKREEAAASVVAHQEPAEVAGTTLLVEKPTESETLPESTTEDATDAQPIETLTEGISILQVSAEAPQVPAQSQEASEPSGEFEVDNEDDDDGEWITPTNLEQHQAKDSGVSLEEGQTAQLSSATMTTDYAMQNVLLQLKLDLISPSMQRIQTLRTYILRCHACFLTTREMERQFCPRCGQPTLNRVSCTTTAKGEFKIHLAKNHTWNNRGNVFSVPKPIAGTASGKGLKGGGQGHWGKNLVLAEDQLEFTRGVEQAKKSKTRDLMDNDYLPGILTGDRQGRQGGRMKLGPGKNVNAKKKRS